MSFEIEADDGMSRHATMMTRATSEQDLAQGVTRWMIGNFGPTLDAAVASTPFTVPLLCAIACREAGAYWLPLTPNRSASEILGLCVYDASGDVAGAPRNAFPVNTAAFRLAYGEAFTAMLIEQANASRTARGRAPASIVYKGYGIFQYDLQHIRTDEDFFGARQWYDIAACTDRAVRELTRAFAVTGTLRDAVRAYNGSGPRAEQYARDVMRLLPACEDAARPPPPGTATLAVRRSSSAPSAAGPTVSDDPATPFEGEISDTADIDTARLLANLGAPAVSDIVPLRLAAPADAGTTRFDIQRAQDFLDACRSSTPRVNYGLGSKVPFHGAVPGRDFTRVDCSGFVREAVRLATEPMARFPDGSVVQHDWIRAHRFERSSVADGSADDDDVRIAFLRPQDSSKGVGHVALIRRGWTLESHGGVGPDSIRWNGQGWQDRAFVYILARGGQFGTAHSAPASPATRTLATTFTVRHGHRYRATLRLRGWEALATNGMIAEGLVRFGFIDVLVTGSGDVRIAEGTWGGVDASAGLDHHITDVVELAAALSPG